MLRVLGNARRLCDGLTRRELLHMSALGLGAGVPLSQVRAALPAELAGSFGKAADYPVSPKDILTTTLHLLGIDPSTILFDRQQRPQPLVAEGRIVTKLLA
jgi:hypothetical protein